MRNYDLCIVSWRDSSTPSFFYSNESTYLLFVQFLSYYLLQNKLVFKEIKWSSYWRHLLIKVESICYSERVRCYCHLSNLCIDFWHTFSVAQSGLAHQNYLNTHLAYNFVTNEDSSFHQCSIGLINTNWTNNFIRWVLFN